MRSDSGGRDLGRYSEARVSSGLTSYTISSTMPSSFCIPFILGSNADIAESRVARLSIRNTNDNVEIHPGGSS